MKILHISAECYPAAKAGGLGDVVGALPKYLTASGTPAAVIMPKYNLKFMQNNEFEIVHHGSVRIHNQHFPFTIERVVSAELGYDLYMANIPGKFDRAGIYADPHTGSFGDSVSRWLCFQQTVLHWVVSFSADKKPKVLHCHDHHTGLIPFMVKHCPEYKSLANIPTVFTIHNGQYHGNYSWDKLHLLPYFDAEARSLLDWKNTINPLATGIKCCWRLTTVSQSYLEELTQNSNGLESLVGHEWHKARGIINGIDNEVWNPTKDSYLAEHLKKKNVSKFKAENKKVLADHFNIDINRPIFTFIGRLVGEKGAEIIPDLVRNHIKAGYEGAFLLLGTGQKDLMEKLKWMPHEFPGRFDARLEYNEGLAHQMYAGSDFLLMPSRVEPCGLNQMYSMRYGTIPVVRAIGGLKDTVIDVGDEGGRGFRFQQLTVEDAFHAVRRATEFYRDADKISVLRERIMNLDFSWQSSAKQYSKIYDELISVSV